MSRSAAASTYTWHTPSAWPMTGMRERSMMLRTNAFEPRGMIRSTYSSSASSALTSSRVCSRPSAPAGTPQRTAASCIAAKSARLVASASLPPLSSAALPLLRHRDAICTSASGRDSKITPITPIGQETRYRSRPGASCVASSVQPSGSGSAASACRPSSTVRSLASSKRRRLSSGAARCCSRARARSARLASKMSARRARSVSAAHSSARLRTSALSAASAGAASRAACASVRGVVTGNPSFGSLHYRPSRGKML